MAKSAKSRDADKGGRTLFNVTLLAALTVFAGLALYVSEYDRIFGVTYDAAFAQALAHVDPPILDTAKYNAQMLALAHINIASTTLGASLFSDASSTLLEATTTASTSVAILGQPWPKSAEYPLPGALLPANRIVAYYGNFYSTGMGVLGEYPPAQVLSMLASTTAEWQAADPSTPVIPAIDYIAVTAQASKGVDGKYRLRMPDSQIEQAISMANQIHGIVILDVQVGLSTPEIEVPLLAKYLSMPNVELALDPEFAMHDGEAPGSVIGTLDASDINWAAGYLASLVTANNLPPKILIVHRFTEDMVTNASKVAPLPQVEIVMDMDGWGSQAKKINTYERVIASEPVQFTGFKLFYKNDLKPPSTGLLSPQQVLSLTPSPVFIQYQ